MFFQSWYGGSGAGDDIGGYHMVLIIQLKRMVMMWLPWGCSGGGGGGRDKNGDVEVVVVEV